MIDKSISYPYNFSVSFIRIPNVAFMCQEVTIPTMSISQIRMEQDPFQCPIPGDKMVFDDVFTLTGLNDEDFRCYQEIHDWMWEMRNPENSRHISVQDCYSDAIVTVRGNNQQVIGYYHFVDCFPTRLPGPVFKSNTADAEPMPMSVDFAFTRFKFSRTGFPAIPT